MANRTAKRYLMQIEKLDRIIENKLVEKQQWKDIALGTSPQMTGEKVQSSGNQQKMADAVDRYIDIEREIDEYIDQLIDVKKDIIATIEQLEVEEYDLLHKIYVQRLTLQEAADAKDKSYSWATTIHGTALENVRKILDERGYDGI